MQRKPELLQVFPSFPQAWYPWASWWGLAWKNPHNPTLYYIILCHITIQTFTPHNPTHLYTHRVLVGVSCGLNGVNRLLRYRCRLQCTLSLEKAVQSGKFRFFQILCHIRIDVQRRRDIRMPQGILDTPSHPQAESLPGSEGNPGSVCWRSWKCCRSSRIPRTADRPPAAWSCRSGR